MTQQATDPTSVTADPNANAQAPAAPDVGPDLDEMSQAERLAHLKGKPVVGAPKEPAPAAPADAAKAKSDREARIKAFQEQERAARHKEKARQEQAAASKAKDDEIAALRKQLAERPPVELKTAADVIALAKRLNVSSKELGEAIIEAHRNPEVAAERQVKAAMTPVEAKLKELEERQRALDEQERTRAQQAERASAEAHARSAFIDHVKASQRTEPLTAAFLAKHGSDSLYGLALQVANSGQVPPNSGFQGLLDAIEQNLELFQLANPGASPAPSKEAKPNPAAAQANTLTNEHGSARSTVTEEVDFDSLSQSERIALLKKRSAGR